MVLIKINAIRKLGNIGVTLAKFKYGNFFFRL